MKRLVFALVFAFVFVTGVAAGPVWAQSFNQGVAAFQAGDYATAFNIWLPLAEKNDAEAQRNIGVMYQQGLGVPQDAVQAATWYRRAAEGGYAPAQYRMGLAYQSGAGVKLDKVRAHAWFNLAAALLEPGHERDNAVARRDALAQGMTVAERTEAERMASEWIATRQ